MSNVNCDSCANLREYAPEFVQNGVTSRVSTSLKNNTGFNPSLSVLHENCEDLNDANDCLIGRMPQELAGYDVCEWKEFMRKLLPNQYEMLKAIIASECGVLDRTERLCNGLDAVLDIIQGGAIKSHPGTWFDSFLAKIETTAGGQPIDKTLYHPSFDAEILSGTACNASKRLGRWALSTYWDRSWHPYMQSIRVTQDLSAGELLGVVPRSAVPAADYAKARWDNLLRGSQHWLFYTINGDTLLLIQGRGYVTIDGVTFNEDLASYGEGNLVFCVGSFIGPSRQGPLGRAFLGSEQSYNA